MRHSRLFGAAVGAGLLLSLGVAGAASAQQQPVTVTLGVGRDDSSIKGTATLTDMGNGQTQVVVNVNPGFPDMLAHIHSGTCPGAGPVVYPLTDVKAGTSTTMVAAPLATVLSKGNSINLHKSPTEGAIYVSCGNIQVAGAQATPAALPNTGGFGEVGSLAAAAGALLVGAGYVLRRRFAR